LNGERRPINVNYEQGQYTLATVDSSPALKSKVLDTDEKFSFTFSKPGIYPYFLLGSPEDDRQSHRAVSEERPCIPLT